MGSKVGLKRILIAEDSAKDLSIFTEALSAIGFAGDVRVATDGFAVLKSLGSEDPPDVIFMDINMPGKDGIETLLEMKSAPATRKIPVVVFSGSTLPKDVNGAYEAGACFFMQKPEGFGLLKDLLKKFLDFYTDVVVPPVSS